MKLRSYGFHRELGRSRSATRKSMTRRRSSTPPSSKSARHRGPTRGSCSIRIGVTARSSGTTITTPAPTTKQPRARRSAILQSPGRETRHEKSNGYRPWRPPRRRWSRRRSPCGRRRGSCSRGGRRRWPAVGKRAGFRRARESESRGREEECATWSHCRKDWSLPSSGEAADDMVFDELRDRSGVQQVARFLT